MTNSPKSLPPIALALFVATVSACSSGSSIRSDYDRTADFSNYRTYDFMEGAGPDREGYESLFTKYMIAAISLEMENRGYRRLDAPDLLVNFNAVLQEKTKVSQTSAPPLAGGYYGYRRGFYDPWRGYGYSTQTNISQYTEGTLNIDIIDARKKQLVWEAVGVGRITEKKLENLEETVNEAVPKLFARYPFRSAGPIPRPVK